jgi:hypothetical protein
MKIPYIAFLFFVLCSCSWFYNVPPEVAQGQLQAYTGIKNIEDNINVMMDEFEIKQKLFVTYIHNFAFERKVMDLERDNPSNLEELITVAATKRDADIKAAHIQIDENITKWRKIHKDTLIPVKELMEAVYNNISTNPISVDNIAIIIERSARIWNKITEERERSIQ